MKVDLEMESLKEPMLERKVKKEKAKLQMFLDPEKNCFEIGIDEAGRGPLFGRLYVAGVVLPREGFDPTGIKDSKLIKSKTKIRQLHAYIISHALAYHVHFIEPSVIDKINIRQAVLQGMRVCATEIMKKLAVEESEFANKHFLMIDGNDFQPLTQFDETTNQLSVVPYDTFVGGDGRFVVIAAASILAKVERDNYIMKLCKQFPYLSELYGMDSHMGYGTKQHLEAIRTYGITQFHRRSYGCCKSAELMLV